MAGPDLATAESERRRYRRTLVSLFFAGYATFAQAFDTQAVLRPVAEEYGLDSATASLIVSAGTLGMALSVLPWSLVADRIGRVSAMKISLVVSAAIGIAAPLLPSFPEIVIARLLVGAALGAVPAVALAYLAEEFEDRRVAFATGTYVAGNTLGGVAGRLGAGLLIPLTGWRPALEVVTATTIAASIAFFVLIPRARAFVPRPPRPRVVLGIVGTLVRDPRVGPLYAVGFLAMGAFAGIYNFMGHRLTSPPIGMSPVATSLIFAVYFVGTLAARLAPGLAARRGSAPAMLSGCVLMVLSPLLTLVDDGVAIVAGLAAFTFGCFLVQPLAAGLVARLGAVGRAQATALYQLAWLLGSSTIGLTTGTAIDAGGWPAAVLVLSSAPAVALVVVLIWRRSTASSPV